MKQATTRTTPRGWRPFWVHQAGEYLLGFVLIAAAVQSPEPTFPILAGGLIVVNAAIVTGPLGAFRAFTRKQHRLLDLVVAAVVLVTAVMPFLTIDNTSRLMMVGIVAVMMFLWFSTSFETRVKSAPTAGGDRGEAIGRRAGRLVNRGRDFVRKQQVD